MIEVTIPSPSLGLFQPLSLPSYAKIYVSWVCDFAFASRSRRVRHEAPSQIHRRLECQANGQLGQRQRQRRRHLPVECLSHLLVLSISIQGAGLCLNPGTGMECCIRILHNRSQPARCFQRSLGEVKQFIMTI